MIRDKGLKLAAALAATLAATAAPAGTITVNSTSEDVANDGACTLHEAIGSANANTASGANPGECAAGEPAPVVDAITFAIAGGGVQTIHLTGPLPHVNEAVVIDGYTEPEAQPNTLAIGDDAVLLIEVDGSALAIDNLLQIDGSGSTIRGLVINRAVGVSVLVESDDNVVEGNFFNTDPSGTELLGGGFTVMRISGSNNVIGGPDPGQRNVFGGGGGSNAGTLMIGGNGNLIQGNYIGVDASGSVPLQPPNGVNGIELGTGGPASNTVIGGDTAGTGNVIFATNNTIRISGGVTDTTIQGNHIGVDAAGTAAVSGANIGITTDNGPAGILIGGLTPLAGNVISGFVTAISLVDGANAVVIQGNRIGTDASGTRPIRNSGDGIFVFTNGVDSLIGGTDPAAANTIANSCGQGIRIFATGSWPMLGNSIHSNRGLGISLNSGTPTVNDDGDGDTGSNGLQNYPVIASATVDAGDVTLSGTFNSTASTTYRLEFFGNLACDASGFGEGENFIGTTDVTTDTNGNASFGPLSFAVPPGITEFSATATDPDGNTSEFAACAGLHDHLFADGFEGACG